MNSVVLHNNAKPLSDNLVRKIHYVNQSLPQTLAFITILVQAAFSIIFKSVFSYSFLRLVFSNHLLYLTAAMDAAVAATIGGTALGLSL